MGGVKIDKNADPSLYQTNSSRTTVFSLLNSMVGGTMLLLPIMFNNTGLIMSSFIIILSGIISCKGSDIYVQHLKTNEFDIQDTIKRIMGRKWSIFFIAMSTLYMVLVTLLYYIFTIQMLYNIITFIQEKSGNHNYADESEFSFKQFSVQYLVLGTSPIFLSLLFLKDLTFLIKIAELGVYAIYSYVVFIFYAFIQNLVNGTVQDNTNKIKLFSLDIGGLGGTASLAFQIQTNVCPMIKCNKDQSTNRRNVRITYLLGTLVYLAIGIIGGFGVLGRNPRKGLKEATTIVEFFETSDWQPLVVEILYLVHLISMYPILFDICRTRIYELVYSKQGGHPPKVVFVLSNIFFVILCGAIKFAQVKPDQLANLNGSFSCFFIVYFFPPLIQLSCYHGSNKFLRSIKNSIIVQRHNNNEDQLKEQLNVNKDAVEIVDDDKLSNVENTRRTNAESCNDHTSDISFIPKNVRIFVYVSIFLLGLVILIYGLYEFAKQI